MDDVQRSPVTGAQSAIGSAAQALSARTAPPVRWREIASLLAIVGLADAAIYRGEGYAGWAAVLAATPLLLLWGRARRQPDPSWPLLALMLALAAGKLVWCGMVMTAIAGVALLPCFALALAGRRPYVLDLVTFTGMLVYHGGRGFAAYERQAQRLVRRIGISKGIEFTLPLVVGLAFSTLFVLANPDVVDSISHKLAQAFDWVRSWLDKFSPAEGLFLFLTTWVAVAFLRPSFASSQPESVVPKNSPAPADSRARSAKYRTWRNTLVVVIGIYAFYLQFEFRTLWFRVFPTGFSYSGYAHEGAAWLTVSLAVATSMLSLIFRGSLLEDARVRRLERLAWAWSVENLLLAIAVYHRLFIYIGFNGMSRLRILGLIGVSAVFCGFAAVLVKIVRRRDFEWLLQRHGWVLAIAIYVYAIGPVDWLAMRYNVRRIRMGNPAPSVQIAVQPISAEGLLALRPLLDDPNPIIRNGVAALLARRLEEIQSRQIKRPHWTTIQLAERQFVERFEAAILLDEGSNRPEDDSTRPGTVFGHTHCNGIEVLRLFDQRAPDSPLASTLRLCQTE